MTATLFLETAAPPLVRLNLDFTALLLVRGVLAKAAWQTAFRVPLEQTANHVLLDTHSAALVAGSLAV